MLDSILTLNNLYIKIILISALPITELRFSIPYFILAKNIHWSSVFILSIIGNILIGVLIIYIIAPAMIYLKQNIYLSRPINYILHRTRSRSLLINNFKLFGLIIFVSIPMPFTGVWTGALAANLLSIGKKRAVIGIIIGVIISACIVTILTLLGNEIWINFIENEVNKKLGIIK